MVKFQAKTYTINDILGWDERKELVLNPSFQRRKVWSPRGKSFLMDSIIKGFPLPQIFIREKVITKDRKTVREVIDGQQRIRAILEYIKGDFTIHPIHNDEYCKKKFEELPEEVQQSILFFPLSVNTLIEVDEGDVLSIFSRLNVYSVPLNAQEKLNAEFLGAFKQKMDFLSRENLAYWENNGILNKGTIARMKEIELTAELVSAMMEGLQNGKAIIKIMYKKYDDEFPAYDYLHKRFNETLNLCKLVTNDSIAGMEFSRSPLFYSLFCGLYDAKYGLKSNEDIEEKSINKDALEDVKQKVYKINQSVSGEENYQEYKDFVDVSKSSTDKIGNRTIRHRILKELFVSLFA